MPWRWRGGDRTTPSAIWRFGGYALMRMCRGAVRCPRGLPPVVARLRRAVGGLWAASGGPGRQEAIMTAKRRLTETEREQRRAQDRQRLKDAAEQLVNHDRWQRWLRVRARGGLARLSLNNQLLVTLACPGATFVAGFRAWLKLGYCPVKGSKAIRIMAPMPVRERDPQTGEKTEEARVLFKAVSVFDREQVAAIDG